MSKINKNILKDELVRIDNISSKINSLINISEYISKDMLENFIKDNSISVLPLGVTFNISLILFYNKYKNKFNEVSNRLDKLADEAAVHNKKIIENKIENFKKICGKVENRELDDEQIETIVRDDRNQLVIAGAGCGKTTTIVGKVKYLVKVLKVDPKDILLLSFTRKSATDMKKRVESEIGTGMECFTFHKLGLEISKQELGELSVYEGNIRGFIKEQIKKLIQNEDYLYALVYFLTVHSNLIKDEFFFKTEKDYKEYIEINPPVTIKGEIVKSFGELEIANYLFSNNINYIYEDLYKYHTDTTEYGMYHPDFYLPDYDIYIEYYGIDREGNVPNYFSSRHGKSPKEEYNDGIKWKRELHKEHNTTLIETYYYENKEGNLKANLETKLKSNGVALDPLATTDIFKFIENRNRCLIDNIARSFEMIINLVKCNDYKLDEIYKLAEVNEYKDNILVTLELIRPIFDEYDEYLAKNKLIDFNDMINLATSVVSSGKYKNEYKYVIVDEFQDISISRYKLLKVLRDSFDYKLYCVGDDFQSIYRFAGSDIGIFTNFKKYFGEVQISKIEKTHRFSSKLAKISGEFIMKNSNQIPKELKGYHANGFPVSEISAYSLDYALKFLEEKLDALEENSSIFFLGRYNYDIEILKNLENFQVTYNKERETYVIIYNKRKDLRIEFLTVHRSKGLEADYVIILNNRGKGNGFPNKIMDMPIIQLLLDNSDNYPYSEERRLFYVALTRARNKVFLLVEQNNKSIFIKELEFSYSNDFEREKYECPKCGRQLKVIDNGYSRFFGCSNYPTCKYSKSIDKKSE